MCTHLCEGAQLDKQVERPNAYPRQQTNLTIRPRICAVILSARGMNPCTTYDVHMYWRTHTPTHICVPHRFLVLGKRFAQISSHIYICSCMYYSYVCTYNVHTIEEQDLNVVSFVFRFVSSVLRIPYAGQRWKITILMTSTIVGGITTSILYLQLLCNSSSPHKLCIFFISLKFMFCHNSNFRTTSNMIWYSAYIGPRFNITVPQIFKPFCWVWSHLSTKLQLYLIHHIGNVILKIFNPLKFDTAELDAYLTCFLTVSQFRNETRTQLTQAWRMPYFGC